MDTIYYDPNNGSDADENRPNDCRKRREKGRNN